MNKFWTSIIVAALGTSAFSQGPIYMPAKTFKDQNITVRGWGSGTIAETDETAFEGTYSVRVSSRNFFQGGLITFGNPVDWSKAATDGANLFRITFRVADQNLKLGGSGGGAAGGGDSDVGTAGNGGAGGKIGGGGAGFAGAGQGTTTKVDTSLKRLRMIVRTTDGMKSEAYVNVAAGAANKGWRSVAIPFKAINGFDKTNMMIKEIGFAADATSTFYIGDLRVVSDLTPITGEIRNGNMNLALGDEVEFKASGFGGSSVLKFTWDFNEKDGIQEDAEGQAVKRKFRLPGTYVVTLTVSDSYGLKKPYAAKITVKVNG